MFKFRIIKQNIKENLLEYLFYIFIFLLPWQTRWIFHNYLIQGVPFEYGRMSLYVYDIVLISLLSFFVIKIIRQKFGIINYKLSIINKFKKLDIKYWLFSVSLLLVIYCLFSVFWSREKIISLYWGIRMLVGWGLFYLIQRINFSKIKLAIIIVIVGAIQSLLAIWQFLNQNVWSIKWLGMAGHKARELGASVVEFGLERWLRAYGSWPHPNILGAFLILVIMALIYLSFRIKSKYHKIWLIFSAGFINLGILFSYSRTAWLGFLLVYLSTIIYLLRFKDRDKNKYFVRGLLIYLMLILIVFGIATWPIIKTRLNIGESTRLEIMSKTERLNGYQQAEKLLKDNWLFGTGIGNYTFELQQIIKPQKYEVWDIQPIHNVLILVLVELGLFGLLIISLLLFFISILLIKQRKWNYINLLLIIFILMSFDHWWWTTASGVYILWITVGLITKELDKID